MTPLLAGVLVYVALQLGLGFVIARRIRDEEDYLVGGRRFGHALSIGTIFATWFGAETCIGVAGAVHGGGLSHARGEPLAYALCLLLMGLVYARALWSRKLTTFADLLARRYGPTTERVGVLLMVPSSVLWAAAQIRAFGQVLSATSSLPVEAGIAIAALVVIAYTAAGGLWADAISDLIQGGVLVLGLVVLAVALAVSTPWEAVAPHLSAERLTPWRAGEPWPLALEAWAVPIFGSVLSAELVSRVIAARSPEVARRSTLIAMPLYLVVGAIPVAIGVMGPAWVTDLHEGDQLLVTVATTILPTVAMIVFAGALVSAILSTVDSALLVAGGLVGHNLVLPRLPAATAAHRLLVLRVAVVVLGAFAWLIAATAEGVYAIVVEASAFGTAGMFVVGTFALFSNRGGPATATATLVTGAATYVVGEHAIGLSTPYLAALAASLVCFLVGAALERR